MMAAAWPLSAVAGLLPASLSLTLLLATLVSILVLGAAAVFFEHIRKIGCMHSLERSAVSDAFFEDPNSLKKVPCPSVFDPPEKYISLIVPAYNEEHRLPEALTETLNYLKRRSTADKSFSYEVLIVDDGSTDRTSKVAFGFVKQHKIDNVRVLLLGRNHGKGEAVRKGMLHSRGELLLMLDADGATKVTDLEKLEAQNSAIYPSIAKEVQLLVKRGTAHLLRMSHLHKYQLQMQVEVQVEGKGEGEEEGVEKEEEEVQVLQVQVKHLELKEQKGLEHKEEEEEEEEGWLHY